MTHSTLSQLAQQEKLRREILHKGDLIPPLPELVVRLLGVLNKPDTEPGDLELLLQNDQVLVAKMLAMVNSPFYGLNRPIRTIKDAVMVLGFRGVRSLVLATSTAKLLQGDYTCYGHEPKGLWLHAVCVAAGARALAHACRIGADRAEQIFVAGLLHDIGKLMLAPCLAEHRLGGLEEAGVVEHERRALGIDHTEAGALVTAKWNLSSEVQEVVKAHHDDDVEVEMDRAIAIVRIADGIATGRGIGYLPGNAPPSQIRAADLASLGLSAQAWNETCAAVAATMDDAAAALATTRP